MVKKLWQWLRPAVAVVLFFLLLFETETFVLIAAGTGAVLLTWVLAKSFIDHRQQRKRDKDAERAVHSEDVEGFVLYLRPFNRALYAHMDMKLGEVFSSTWRSGGNAIKRVQTVEEQLVAALPVPVVGVGSRRKESKRSPGYAQVTDEEWQERVESLMRRAGAIVIVPWGTVGTQWEVAKIAQNESFLNKTVFLMPNFHAEYIYRMLPLLRTFAGVSRVLSGTFDIRPNSVMGASFLLLGKAIWRVASLFLAVLEFLFAGVLFFGSLFVKSDLSGKWNETCRKSQKWGLPLPRYDAEGASFVFRQHNEALTADMYPLETASVSDLVSSLIKKSNSHSIVRSEINDDTAELHQVEPIYLVRRGRKTNSD